MADKLEFTTDAIENRSVEDTYSADIALLAKKTQHSRENILLRGYATVIIAMAVTLLVMTAAIIVMAVGWSHEQGTVVPEVIEVEKEVTVEVPMYTVLDPSVEYSHELASDRIMLNDSNYGPIWVPALESVAKNEYIPELFSIDEQTGYLSYNDPSHQTLAGIDVSVYQGLIDWDKVKAAGFDFVMIRCGNRGYVTGLVVEDANFKANIKGALDAGLKVGIYFFSQALTTDEALAEAEFVCDLLDGYDISFPVAFDWEVVIDKDGDTPRTAYIQPDQLTDNFLVFAQYLQQKGYTPIIYANKKTAVWKYDLSRTTDYDIWYAEYSDTPSLYYDFSIWQYSSHGSVPGIDGDVDLNICFKDYSVEEQQ